LEYSRIPAQSLQEGSSLLRSVTISDRLHHDGGFGDPPNDDRSAMYPKSPNMMTDCIVRPLFLSVRFVGKRLRSRTSRLVPIRSDGYLRRITYCYVEDD